VLAFPLFSMAYYTMIRTPTPEFCASCHEIKPAVVAWRSSTHVNNPQGVVADCMDCHWDMVHNNQVTIMYKQYRKLPYQAKGLRSL
jgi:nitrate/TMAO reductase-like tetraheme cytochrome c subunit